MNHSPTVLEISSSAVSHNLNYFRSLIDVDTLILAVVKASGYGSDSTMMASFLERQGVDYFAVAYVDEGISLREAGISKPILVLHPQLQNLDLLIQYELEPNLYSKKILMAFLDLSRRKGLSGYPVHLKFNTGLNRLGFKGTDLEGLHSVLKDEPGLRVKSLFSHLVASEDDSLRSFTLNQIGEFKRIASDFERLWAYLPIRHMTNTSGVMNFPEARFDMIRVGIGLYGFANDEELDERLENALRLKSVISQIHRVSEGENVGYNFGFTARENCRTATIPIGHADGIFRSLGQGKISVRINGLKAPVIGNICMDMIMADVTGIECEEGDEVVIFDSREDILELARQARTIPYEILTALGPRIRRVLV